MLSWIDGDDVDVTSRLTAIGLDRVRVALAQERPGNFVFSPLGAVLSLGAATLFRGDEHPSAELLEWLGSRRETVAVNLADALKLEWETFKAEEGIKMHWGVYYDDSFTRAEGFSRGLEYVSRRMGVPVVKTQFPSPGAEEINQAAREATNGLIGEVVGSATAVNVADVTVIYLKRPWAVPFHKVEVREWRTPWSSRPITFMGRTGIFDYAETLSYRYVRLIHMQPADSCLEIFFKKGDRALPTDLTLKEMEKLRARAAPARMWLFMPKWDFQADTNVVDLLPEACATALRREVDPLRMVQSVRMVVDEETLWDPRTPEEVVTLDLLEMPFGSWYVDHPFVFAVCSRGETEFIGCACEMEDMGGGPVDFPNACIGGF